MRFVRPGAWHGAGAQRITTRATHDAGTPTTRPTHDAGPPTSKGALGAVPAGEQSGLARERHAARAGRGAAFTANVWIPVISLSRRLHGFPRENKKCLAPGSPHPTHELFRSQTQRIACRAPRVCARRTADSHPRRPSCSLSRGSLGTRTEAPTLGCTAYV